MNIESKADLSEIVHLGALDSEFFARTFFARAARYPSPLEHQELWRYLDDPSKRFVNLRVFRGGAKTTRLRIFNARRIAYGFSKTILYIGAAEDDAIRSIQWLRNAIERNKLYANTFGLRPGRKWEETQLEVIQEVEGVVRSTIWVKAAGISSSIRGINFDDYRPDSIILDDIVTDENVITEAQREKTNDLVLSAIKNSLASEVDEPNAKMVMSQTPIHKNDVSARAAEDPQWATAVFPCWTKDTMDSPVDEQVSSWPEMFPTETLRADKRAAIARNKLSLFSREMECRLIAPEECAFKSEWIQYWDDPLEWSGAFCILAIDPVPPPSDRQLAEGLKKKDYEAISVVGRKNGKYAVLACVANRGHDPDWTLNQVFRLASLFRVVKIVIEAVGYQRTLKYMLEKEMIRRMMHYPVIPIKADMRSKFNRIVSGLHSPLQRGLLYLHRSQSRLIQQIISYPKVDFDDDIESVAIGLGEIQNPYIEIGEGYFDEDNDQIPEIRRIGGCP
jgi:phage terminase large subunit-like protein